MIKEWFIKIDGKEEGPYSPRDLKGNRRVTMQTLARHKDRSQWLPIWEIPQLRQALEERRGSSSQEAGRLRPEVEPDGEMVMAAGGGMGPWQWVIVAIILILILVFWGFAWS